MIVTVSTRSSLDSVVYMEIWLMDSTNMPQHSPRSSRGEDVAERTGVLHDFHVDWSQDKVEVQVLRGSPSLSEGFAYECTETEAETGQHKTIHCRGGSTRLTFANRGLI